MTLLGLPPKGNFDWKQVARKQAFLEDRRNGLQVYINHIADQIRTMSDNPVVQNFLLNEGAPGSPSGDVPMGSAPSGGRSDSSRSPRRSWFSRKETEEQPEEFELTETSRPSGLGADADGDAEIA